jgi:YD repeat-containing protein
VGRLVYPTKPPTPENPVNKHLLALLLLAVPSHRHFAEAPLQQPVLEFASGLPGQQVRLLWPAEPGLRYRIEKSTTLSQADGSGTSPWKSVAMVEATSDEADWLDPEPTTSRAFYRVSLPDAEIFSLSPPLLSTSGGTIIVTGQRLPPGGFLTLEIEGVGQVSAPLEFLAPGRWRAEFSFVPPLTTGVHITSVTSTDGSGLPLATAGQVITVTESGRAADAPSSVPPAAPVMPTLDSNKPVPGIGIVIKSNTIRQRAASAGGEDCDDGRDFALAGLLPATNSVAIKTKGTGAQPNRAPSSSPGGGVDNDCDTFALSGLMPTTNSVAIKTKGTGAEQNRSSGPYRDHDSDNDGLSLPAVARMAINAKGTGASHGRIFPAASSLPGEVSFHTCPIEVVSPAGPSLAWVCTYRSMAPISSGHGPGWDFSYNISIEPIPANSGTQAPRLLIRDGGGRADIFHRQSDGSYRCDGLFREGRFTGNTFSLTFADTGTWNFLPLDGSPASGKISTITSRHDLSLTCAYDGSGQLTQVSDSFGGSLSVDRSPTGQISSVSDHTGRSVHFTAFSGEAGGSPGDLKSISCPQLPGVPPLVGELSFSYSTGSSDPRLNHNLLSITDGAGRLVEAYTYSSSANPTDISYDTCSGNDRHRTSGNGPVHRTSFETLPSGDYLMSELDEVGRLTQTTYDRLHRALSVRQFTGFATPGVLPASLPLSGKIRPGDPDFFETTFAYNADHLCTRVTHPDGTREAITHDRELRRGCPVIERGNPRIFTLTSPLGEFRTVSCDYLPGFGTTESARPGNPIGGLTIKAGRNPGGDISPQNRPGNPISGLNIKAGRNPGGDVVAQARSSGSIDDDCDGIPSYASVAKRAARTGRNPQTGKEIKVSAKSVTPAQSPPLYLLSPPAPTFLDPVDNDCDGDDISALIVFLGKKGYDYYQAQSGCSFVSRVVTSYGQTFAWSHNARGDIISRTSPIPGQGTNFEYLPDGRCTSVTELNGAGEPMEITIAYGGPGGGITGATRRRSSGPSLTTAIDRDDLNRITRITDPLSQQWHIEYSPEGLCTLVSSPPVPAPISLHLSYDPAGELARCDLAHLDADGSPVADNPSYSTFLVRNNRGRLIRLAREERPVDGSSTLDPATLGIENFSAIDITYDASGACVALTTPAACRAQATDAVTSFILDERGMLHRCVEGGIGNPDAVTTEYDYNPRGALTRVATIASGLPSPETFFAYDGFHRLSSVTDPMGNQTTFDYLQNGSVMASCYGELLDVPGDANNILLARTTTRTRGGGDCQDTGPNALFTRNYHYAHVDTQIVERFTPGSSAPAVLETTNVHRSPAGLVMEVVCNGDTRVGYEYDELFRLVGITDGSCTLTFTLDGRDDVLVCGRTDHFRSIGNPDKTFTTSCVRDALGRITSSTDGAGNETVATYDSLGRTTSLALPGRAPLLHAYDGTSPVGDPFSVLLTCDVAGTGTAEVLASVLVRCGELRSTTDSYGHSTHYTYDALHRLTRCDLPDGTFSTNSFDSRGFPYQDRLLDGRIQTLTHDSCARVTSSSWSDLPADVVAAGTSTLHYDGLHRLVSTTQDSSTVSFTYDSCGNPLSETSNGQTVHRTFSHRGRTGITYPDDRSFAESRGSLGELLSISALDGGGAPMLPPIVSYDYVGHRVHTATQANGTVTTHTYRGDADVTAGSSFDTCIRTVTRDASSTVLSDVTVQRDASQLPTRCVSLLTADPDGPARFQTFGYDLLGRRLSCLTERRETTGGQLIEESDVAYTLDLEGRRLLATGGENPGPYSQNSKIPPGDQQMGQYSIWPGGDLIWDDAGSLRALARGATTHAYTYDAEGRFLACDDATAGTPVCSVTYDALGRVSSLTVHGNGGLPAATTAFVYDGATCIQELTDASGTGILDPNLTFVSARGIQVCISTRNGSLYYPHSSGGSHTHSNSSGSVSYVGPCDASVTAITDSSGTIIERISYDDACKPAFLTASGQPSQSGASGVPIRWIVPGSIWEPTCALHLCPDGTFSPDFGSAASAIMGGGHVTVLKAAAKGGEGMATGKRDHSSGQATGMRQAKPTRSPSYRGHVTVLKAAATGGGGGPGGSTKAQDHNSSRSNKSN